MDFISLIPEMDKEVAKAVIAQFPSYVTFSIEMIRKLNESCQRILDDNNESQRESINSYMLILQSLSRLLEKDNLTMEEMQYITENMILIADKIAAKDTENKEFLKDTKNRLGNIIMFVVCVGVTILGVNGSLSLKGT